MITMKILQKSLSYVHTQYANRLFYSWRTVLCLDVFLIFDKKRWINRNLQKIKKKTINRKLRTGILIGNLRKIIVETYV